MRFVDLETQRERLRTDIDRAIAEVLKHGRFIMGPEVTAFESELGAYIGVDHVVTCANGTDALQLALRALGVAPGDRVVVPTFTFAATAEAVALVGAVPVFADVRPDTFDLDAESALAAMSAQAAAGVIAVDLFGLPADYSQLSAEVGDHGFVLADAAQSMGGEVGGRAVGTLTGVTATSFFPAKPLGCYGDGGAVITDDRGMAKLVRSLRAHGKGSHKYDNVRIGTNSRLDSIQAAILRCKLTVLEDEIGRRQRIAERYTNHLADVVSAPHVPISRRSAWSHYTIVTDARDRMADDLRSAGIPTAVYYPRPLHQQTAYRHFPVAPGGCPVAERLSASVLSLPMHPYLSEKDQDTVIAEVRSVTE